MAFPNENDEINDSNGLVRNLRRQLMRDNSDYSLEDDTKTELQMRANSKLVKSQENGEVLVTRHHSKKQSKENHYKKQKREYYKEISRKNFYIPNLSNIQKIKMPNISSKKEQPIKAQHVVSNKDLFYYMDDQKLVPEPKKKYQNENHHKNMRNDVKSTVKYRYLKLKHPYRRHNQPRLVQEEGAEKFAIVNLDKGPIPELRLPPSRRQYMRDPGEVVADDEEVPPPPVNTSDPEAAPDDETTTKFSITPGTLT
ncbi:unnamed protein product, partial [Brenthis ino]